MSYLEEIIAKVIYMKTVEHQNIQIENFQNFYAYLHKEHPEIMGAEWDSEKKLLKIFYPDNATELTSETLQKLQVPTILIFRKKISQISITNATTINENEFTVETFDPENTRNEVKKKYPEFEET